MTPIGTHSATDAIPGLPGAHHSFSNSGLALRAQHNACSRPPDPITKANLGDVIDTGWITKDKACAGVKAGSVKGC